MRYLRFTRFSGSVAALILLLAVTAHAPAAGNREPDQLAGELLFELRLGKLEDEIDVFALPLTAFGQSLDLTVRDGRVFVASGASDRIMEFTSFGDLLAVYYNPQTGPAPVSIPTVRREDRVTNRRASTHDFVQPEAIAVDSRRTLYVVDRALAASAQTDPELGALTDRVVLRFSADAQYEDYLGREGLGGSPFPRIDRMQIGPNDDLVLFSRVADAWVVFWFDAEGDLVGRFTIDPTVLPVPAGRQVQPVLQDLAADQSSRKLFLKIDLYPINSDTEQIEASSFESIVVWVDVEPRQYAGFATIPESRLEEGLPAELAGIAPGGHLVLIYRQPERAELVVMHHSGDVVARRTVDLHDVGSLAQLLRVGADGIMTALTVYEEHAEVRWWRVDQLIPER